MNISVNAAYNRLLSQIVSGLRVPVDFTTTTKATATNTEDKNIENNPPIIYSQAERYTPSVVSETISKSSGASSVSSANSQSFAEVLTSYITNGQSDIDTRINDAIIAASQKYQVDPTLIKAVMKAESSFNPSAVSRSGAIGLMQLMPATASYLGVTNAYNIEQNVEGGAKYLREMLDTFDGNIEYAVAAYNAGPGAVSKYGGIPPYSETQAYVPRVLEYQTEYLLERYS